MHPSRPRILTTVPQHWPVRMEIVKAIHTLAAQVEEQKEFRKRAEAAEAQQRQEDLRRVRRSSGRRSGARSRRMDGLGA
jgi:hypothetical protein